MRTLIPALRSAERLPNLACPPAHGATRAAVSGATVFFLDCFILRFDETAGGEAAMLLASGEKGHRAALPSASIMIKQPINAFRGQATELEIQRKEIRNTKRQTLELLSKGIGKEYDEIEKDINRPKYFNPWEAVDYGIIDQVLDGGKH